MYYIGSEKHKKNIEIASILGRKKLQELKKQRIQNYNSDPNYCICCNQPIQYEKKNNKFCSSSCSATFNNKNRIVTEEQKIKTSKSLKGLTKGGKKILKEFKRICKCCNSEFIVKRRKNGTLSRNLYCSFECSNKMMKINVGLAQKKLVKNGVHKGWKSRNILSYPEKFFIKVLNDNNIQFEHNLPINKKDLGLNDSSNYFLDFYFRDKKIDLEIDGKQHTYKERKESDKARDENLIKFGIKVYRIVWKSINNDNGKEYMKNEIDKFINFYNIL